MTVTRLPIKYDEGGIVVVHKPAGVLSHPNTTSRKTGGASCAFEGAYDFDERCFTTDKGEKTWLMHRLDQDTSGLLVACRDERSARLCRALFEGGGVRKIYTALVTGRIKPPKGVWSDSILIQRQRGRVRSTIARSKRPNAHLRYRLMRYFPAFGLSLLELDLITGKTHQIRVQSASRGHYLAGDEVYGDFGFNRQLRKSAGLKRMFLHACAIEFTHPVTHERVRVEDPLPEELKAVMERL